MLGVAKIVTRLGLATFRASDTTMPSRAPRGRTAVLVPILPDLSHTFVYRETLELLRRHPDWMVVALERGDSSVIHREAAALLERAQFPPPITRLGFLLDYLAVWMTRPRRASAMVRAYQSESASMGPRVPANDPYCFLRLDLLDDSCAPARGVSLARYLHREGVGYVHVYGSTYPSTRALVAHLLYGIPYSVSTFVDFDYRTPFHMLPQKFGAARFVVACTEYCARQLRELVPDAAASVRVLRHALPTDFAKDAKLRSPDGRSRLVFVGRFVPKKGLDILIDACSICATWTFRSPAISMEPASREQIHEHIQRPVSEAHVDEAYRQSRTMLDDESSGLFVCHRASRQTAGATAFHHL